VSFLIGEAVKCEVCGRTKKPHGRDTMDNGMCSYECDGYYEEPRPGDLWPGERREDFGFPLNWREIARRLAEVPDGE
jgi:hypothetical protein